MTILATILAEKKREVIKWKENPLTIPDYSHEKYSLISRLNKNDAIAIIAEFKRASPSKGDINLTIEPEKQAQVYAEYGATAISVLTDSSFFKGSFADLTAIRQSVSVPILCKDFFIDEVQIKLAKKAGADIILLIAAALDGKRLRELYTFAKDQGLEVLIEVHNEDDLNKALQTDARLIGVNNRDLKTFTVNLQVTEKLGPIIKAAGRLLISESGMKSGKDVNRAVNAGANGILVGEALMKANHLASLLNELKLPLTEVEK